MSCTNCSICCNNTHSIENTTYILYKLHYYACAHTNATKVWFCKRCECEFKRLLYCENCFKCHTKHNHVGKKPHIKTNGHSIETLSMFFEEQFAPAFSADALPHLLTKIVDGAENGLFYGKRKNGRKLKLNKRMNIDNVD